MEIAAFLSSLVLLVMLWRADHQRRAFLIAILCYGAMLADFFLFNNPVNLALNRWTATTLPADWSQYRMPWETGHAIAAALCVTAYVVLIRQRIREGAKPWAAQPSAPASSPS